jgi:hypothetical protein
VRIYCAKGCHLEYRSKGRWGQHCAICGGPLQHAEGPPKKPQMQGKRDGNVTHIADVLGRK